MSTRPDDDKIQCVGFGTNMAPNEFWIFHASGLLCEAAELLEYLIGNSWQWGLSHELVERMDSLRVEIRETIGKENK